MYVHTWKIFEIETKRALRKLTKALFKTRNPGKDCIT